MCDRRKKEMSYFFKEILVINRNKRQNKIYEAMTYFKVCLPYSHSIIFSFSFLSLQILYENKKY